MEMELFKQKVKRHCMKTRIDGLTVLSPQSYYQIDRFNYVCQWIPDSMSGVWIWLFRIDDDQRTFLESLNLAGVYFYAHRSDDYKMHYMEVMVDF